MTAASQDLLLLTIDGNIGFVRQIPVHGDLMWALIDYDGEPLCISDNRSVPYFYAAEHEITVVMRH